LKLLTSAHLVLGNCKTSLTAVTGLLYNLTGRGHRSLMADGKEVPVSTGTASTANGDSATGTTITHSMAGHLGNLTDQQERAFSTFKENLVKAKLYTPHSENHEASHDDPTLLCVHLTHPMC
jgi:hypothetical protein